MSDTTDNEEPQVEQTREDLLQDYHKGQVEIAKWMLLKRDDEKEAVVGMVTDDARVTACG